jgi:hypothetical protein
MAKATKKHIPTSTSAAPYELEDLWIAALTKLRDGDAKPLADLLRDYATPMPPAARDMFAELLHPGDPGIIGGRLVYVRADGDIKQSIDALPLVVRYHVESDRRKRAGKSDPSQEAARAVGKEYGQSDRSVFRKLSVWRKLTARLRGSY